MAPGDPYICATAARGRARRTEKMVVVCMIYSLKVKLLVGVLLVCWDATVMRGVLEKFLE